MMIFLMLMLGLFIVACISEIGDRINKKEKEKARITVSEEDKRWFAEQVKKNNEARDLEIAKILKENSLVDGPYPSNTWRP